ncbi:MAG: hypothetical protein ACK5WG_13835 [Betaproteobacteria bacterium]
METDIDQNDPPKTVKEMVAIYASASEADMSATLLAKYAPSNKCFYTIEKPLFIAPRSRKETK